MEKDIVIVPIGYIQSEYEESKDVPHQGRYFAESVGVIVMLPEFQLGIQDLKVGQNIEVIFNFNRSRGFSLITPARMGPSPRSVFSTRSPNRPNSLGITIVKILNIDENKITFAGADMLNNTPVIDIKPALTEKLVKE